MPMLMTILYCVGVPFIYGYAYQKFVEEDAEDRVGYSALFAFFWPLVMPFEIGIQLWRRFWK